MKPWPKNPLCPFIYRRYLIQPLLTGGYNIVRDGFIIQHYTATVESAKQIIDSLS